jgi:hypothetical protein
MARPDQREAAVSAQELVDAYKDSGSFDALRKQLLDDFMNSVSWLLIPRKTEAQKRGLSGRLREIAFSSGLTTLFAIPLPSLTSHIVTAHVFYLYAGFD